MTRRSISFLVNGAAASAMGVRATSVARHLPDLDIAIYFRHKNKLRAVGAFLAALVRDRPKIIYVFDMAVSGVTAAIVYKLFHWRCRLVIDTGDVIAFLAKATGRRSWLECRMFELLELISISAADTLVVRSHFHKEYWSDRKASIEVIPDGVEIRQFSEASGAEDCREKFGLSGKVVVGLLGSITWNVKEKFCYGWDLVEAFAALKDLPIAGLIVGDGPGAQRLKEMAVVAGVADRVKFAGRVPYADLPNYLGAMDICLSTQTNDLAGRVRTTGKLPLYLASGKFVIASAVGEAARVLPDSMLLRYDGIRDDAYPRRLALRLRELVISDKWRLTSEISKRVALQNFDYELLAQRLRPVFRRYHVS